MTHFITMMLPSFFLGHILLILNAASFFYFRSAQSILKIFEFTTKKPPPNLFAQYILAFSNHILLKRIMLKW